MRDAIVAFGDDWARRSAPLHGIRAARILHLAAAALALGVIAGLYVRGLAFEYRATGRARSSTRPACARSLAVALAPGALLTGIPVPDVAAGRGDPRAGRRERRALAAPDGRDASPSSWSSPRLAARARARGWSSAIARRASPLPLDEPYFQRLLRGFQRRAGARARGPVQLRGAARGDRGARGDRRARRSAASAALRVASPVAYGDEDALAARRRRGRRRRSSRCSTRRRRPSARRTARSSPRCAARRGPRSRCSRSSTKSAFRARWPGDDRAPRGAPRPRGASC